MKGMHERGCLSKETLASVLLNQNQRVEEY